MLDLALELVQRAADVAAHGGGGDDFGEPAGDAAAGDTTDPTLCRNPAVFYVAWGEQTNVPASDPAGPLNLGLHITRTIDGGRTFENVEPLSVAQGGAGQPIAAETQFNVRPDGDMAFAVWNQTDPGTGTTDAMYSSGTLGVVPEAIGGDTPPAVSGPSRGGWPYLWPDATYVKARDGGRVGSKACVLAGADAVA